jgi:putative transcriptional regulator
MNDASTKIDMAKYPGMTEYEVRRLHAMTDEEITAAALSDPDNPPMTPEQLARLRPPAKVRKLRMTLRMDRQMFSEAYGIPLATLTAWERHELQPTPVEDAYLTLIEREPEIAQRKHQKAAAE